MANRKVTVIGGGIIGLSIAWQLSRRGCSPLVIERGSVGQEASWAAAGMLAADAEIEFEEPELYEFCQYARTLWPDFAATLEDETEISVDYRVDETLMVAVDDDHAEALQRIYRFQVNQGLSVEWLDPPAVTGMEPGVQPTNSGAIVSPADHQVDNRKVIQALRAGIEDQGGTIRENTEVHEIQSTSTRRVVVLSSGERIQGDDIVVAAGAWSNRLTRSSLISLPLRPVKGQVLELGMTNGFRLDHVVRGRDAYLVPKGDGRLMIGATSEEQGFDRSIYAGAVYRLLEGAREVVRDLDNLPLLRFTVGFRPTTRDHRPIIGAGRNDDVVYACGHYRHGILLAPATAQVVTRYLLDEKHGPWLDVFSPQRF